MLFDLFAMGIPVFSGEPDPSAISRFGDATAQAAAILVTPGEKVDPQAYCEGLSASAAYAGLLVGPEELLGMLAAAEVPNGGCMKGALF